LNIIAVGKGHAVESLKLLGFDVCKVRELSEDEAMKVCEKALEAKAIVIEEEVYKAFKHKINLVTSGMKNPPVLIVVPSIETRETSRLKELYSLLSQAVGVKLRWMK